MWRRSVASLILACGCACLYARAPQWSRQPCRGDHDCPEGVCADRVCRERCADRSDCGAGENCRDGACYAASEVECIDAIDCPAGFACANASCVVALSLGEPCSGAGACGSGYCVGGVCCASACTGACLSCAADGSCTAMPADDAGCGIIDCDALDTGCRDFSDLTSGRCAAPGVCKTANSSDCSLYGPAPETRLCRTSIDASCDPTESCDGISEICPADVNNCGAAWYPLGGSDLGPSTAFLTSGSGWGAGVSGTVRSSSGPAAAVGAAGIVLAWTQATAPSQSQIYVRRYSGSAWVEIGPASASGSGVSGSSGFASNPSLAVDTAGNPYLAWNDNAGGGYQVYVKRFDGSTWQALAGSASGGGISNSTGGAIAPKIAVDANDNVYVAWRESGPVDIYIKRFSGGIWEEVGSGSASAGGISNTAGTSVAPALTLDGSDAPIVAWQESVAPSNEDIYVRRFDGASWQEYPAGSASGGGVSGSATRSFSPALAVDAVGPVLAWAEDFDIYVRRYDANSWQELAGSASGGGISSTAGTSLNPSIGVDSNGALVVAWREDPMTSGYRTYARRLGGGVWAELAPGSASGEGVSAMRGAADGAIVSGAGELWSFWSGNLPREVYAAQFSAGAFIDAPPGSAAGGGLSDTPGYSGTPELMLDAAGVPSVAWADDSPGTSQVYLRRFGSSGSWEELNGSASGNGVSQSTLGVAWLAARSHADGRPVVVWDTTDVYLKEWDGAAWVGVAGSDTGGGVSASVSGSQPDLAVDGKGRIAVAWVNYDGLEETYDIHVKEYDGVAWQELAGSATGGGISNTVEESSWPAVAYDATGNLVVAWIEFNTGVYVRRFSGVWQEMGAGSASGLGISGASSWVAEPVVGVDPQDVVVVAWSAYVATQSEIYARRFDGSGWIEIGADSATAGGMSNNSGDSTAPSIAFDSQGRPLIAWQDATSGNYEVYLRGFDGSSWVDVGAGSSTGGGISRSAASSTAPSVDAAGGRICVAWQEPAPAALQIVLRCIDDP